MHRGLIQEYLGMTIDYTSLGKVVLTMIDDIQGVIDETKDILLKGTPTTPAPGHLFNVNPDATPLNSTDAVLYHHLVAKLLYLAKWTRSDLLLAISFLTTWVKSPDEDNFKKLG